MREPPFSLALLRIAVGLVALVSPEPAVARIVAGRPTDLRFAPEGLAWLVPLVTPQAMAVGGAALRASAFCLVLGAYSRVAAVVLASMLLFVFGAAQLTGTVTHDMHLFWYATLLAVVPPDALSLDRWRAGKSVLGAVPSEQASWALRIARTWLGFVYFFPGVHKLAGAGLAWVTSDNLQNQMYFKWYEAGGVVPWPRIDRVPYLVQAGAAAVVVFELAMPALVAFRRTRLVALVLALSFHVTAGHFLDVLFPSLLACLVVLLPGDRLARLLGREHHEEVTATGRGGRVALACVALPFTAAIVVQGIRGATQSYPFACYPTFATLAPDTIVDLAVDSIAPDGTVVTRRLPALRRQDEWGTVWRLSGLYGDPIDPARLEAFAATLGVPAAEEARWMMEIRDVRPASYGLPPRRRVPVHVRSPSAGGQPQSRPN